MLDMTVLITQLLKTERQKRKHPMADPLEGAEWQGLLWTLRLYDSLRGKDREPEKRQERGRRSVQGQTTQCSPAQ